MGEQYGCFSLHEQYRQFVSPVWGANNNFLDTQNTLGVYTTSLTPVSILDIPMLLGGTYTFYMLYRSLTGAYAASVQYYINGVAYDVAGTTTSTSLQTYLRDIAVNGGDVVSFMAWVANVAETCQVNRRDVWEQFAKPVSIPWLYYLLFR